MLFVIVGKGLFQLIYAEYIYLTLAVIQVVLKPHPSLAVAAQEDEVILSRQVLNGP